MADDLTREEKQQIIRDVLGLPQPPYIKSITIIRDGKWQRVKADAKQLDEQLGVPEEGAGEATGD